MRCVDECRTTTDDNPLINRRFVISRIAGEDGRHGELAGPDTELHLNDRVLVISSPADIEAIKVFFGREVDMSWEEDDAQLISRRILITKPGLNGKTLAQLRIRSNLGATVTRVNLLGPIVDQRIDFAGHELRSQMETHYAIDHNLIFEEGDRVGIHIANQLIFDARTMEGVIEDA